MLQKILWRVWRRRHRRLQRRRRRPLERLRASADARLQEIGRLVELRQRHADSDAGWARWHFGGRARALHPRLRAWNLGVRWQEKPEPANAAEVAAEEAERRHRRICRHSSSLCFGFRSQRTGKPEKVGSFLGNWSGDFFRIRFWAKQLTKQLSFYPLRADTK